jgi:hypothetical protein
MPRIVFTQQELRLLTRRVQSPLTSARLDCRQTHLPSRQFTERDRPSIKGGALTAKLNSHTYH